MPLLRYSFLPSHLQRGVSYLLQDQRDVSKCDKGGEIG